MEPSLNNIIGPMKYIGWLYRNTSKKTLKTFSKGRPDSAIPTEVIRTRQMIFKDMLEVPGLQQFISRCETEEWGKELQKTLKLLKMDPNAG